MRRIPRVFDWVVGIALLLALIVIVSPQFTRAGDVSLRQGLQQQLAQLQMQINRYADEHDGRYPELGENANKGWGDLIRGGYISNAPFNLYVHKAQVLLSEQTPELLTETHSVSQTDVGWFYNPITGMVVANGYDHINNTFHDEQGYDRKAFAW